MSSGTLRGISPEGAAALKPLRRALCLAACVAVLQLSAVEPAGAQGNEDEAEYHLKRGRVFLSNGQLAEAIAEFDRAYTLNPSYEYLPDIARTHEELGNYQRAIEAYEAYLRKGGKKLSAAERTHAKAEIERLEKVKKRAANAESARQHLEAGNAYEQQGQYGLAVIEFEEAYKLTGDPAYLYHLGKVYTDKGDNEQAVKYLQRFLDAAGSKMSGADRVAIEREIARLEGREPTSTPPSPTSSSPSMSPSTPTVTGEWEHYFYVGFGYERLGNAAAAIEAFEKYLAGGAGQIDPQREAEVREAIARLRGGGSPSPPGALPQPGTGTSPPPAVTGEEESGGRVWTWVAFGVGGAAAVGAAVTGSLALVMEDDVRSQCEGSACPESTRSEIKTITTLGPVTDVLIGVAAAGVVTGVILYFVEGGDESETAVGLAPLPSGGGAVAIGGRF